MNFPRKALFASVFEMCYRIEAVLFFWIVNYWAEQLDAICPLSCTEHLQCALMNTPDSNIAFVLLSFKLINEQLLENRQEGRWCVAEDKSVVWGVGFEILGFSFSKVNCKLLNVFPCDVFHKIKWKMIEQIPCLTIRWWRSWWHRRTPHRVPSSQFVWRFVLPK